MQHIQKESEKMKIELNKDEIYLITAGVRLLQCEIEFNSENLGEDIHKTFDKHWYNLLIKLTHATSDTQTTIIHKPEVK